MEWIMDPEILRVPLWQYMLLAAAATLLIAVSKGGFGGGMGTLATPMLLLAIPAHVALSLVLPLLIVCDFFTLRQFPKDWRPKAYWLLFPGTFLGLFAGLYALVVFARADVQGDRWIRLTVGVVALLFCILQAIRYFRIRTGRTETTSFKPGPVSGTLTGLTAGFTTMIAHAAGAIFDMFLLAQRMPPSQYVGTCARIYLTFNTIKVPFYIAATMLAEKDYISLETLKWDLWLVPLCPLGVALGAWLHRRISARIFLLIIYVVLGFTGIKMISDAVDIRSLLQP